jgi:hypothetical protein
MQQLWQSADGYVRVVDGVAFPGDDAPEGTASDLDTLFRGGAWIVVWRQLGESRWRFTRNRRYAKPGLQVLRRAMQQEDIDPDCNLAWIAAADTHGHLYPEYPDPVQWGQSLYAAWEVLAAAALPNKIAHLGVNADEPDVERVPAWMRPGLARYVSRRREWREILDEILDEQPPA